MSVIGSIIRRDIVQCGVRMTTNNHTDSKVWWRGRAEKKSAPKVSTHPQKTEKMAKKRKTACTGVHGLFVISAKMEGAEGADFFEVASAFSEK